MKSDEDVRMISAEAPVLFAKVVGAWRAGCGHACAHGGLPHEQTGSGLESVWLVYGKLESSRAEGRLLIASCMRRPKL